MEMLPCDSSEVDHKMGERELKMTQTWKACLQANFVFAQQPDIQEKMI